MPVCFHINPGKFSMLFVKHTYTGVTPELRIELNHSTLSASADNLYNNVHECYLHNNTHCKGSESTENLNKCWTTHTICLLPVNV